jgi:hypothetical protein
VTILLKNSSFSPWCSLLAERPCLHCHSSKENDAIKVKLRSRDHSSTNSKHACTEGSVTNLKRCYGESADNFWLTYVLLIICVVVNEIHLVSRIDRNEGYYIIRNYTSKYIHFIIGVAKSKKLRQDEYAACIRKIKNTYKMSALVCLENQPLGRLKVIWKDNIEVDFWKIINWIEVSQIRIHCWLWC